MLLVRIELKQLMPNKQVLCVIDIRGRLAHQRKRNEHWPSLC